ncbi:MAG TPA: MFS transporter [Burkholderiales bacterium]|nr:MFS transporter [Burkholderiales bacterium]
MPPAAHNADEDDRHFPYWRRNLRVIPLSNLLASLGFNLAWPFLPLMVRGLGVEKNLETWVGNMMLTFYVVSFVMNPIWGGIADHYGRKIMVLRATLGMGACMSLLAFAPSPLWFAFLIMFIGVFNGATAAGLTLLVANTPPRRLGRVLSLAQTGTLTGQTMGPAVGAVLAAVVDREHSLFWIAGGLLLFGGALVAAYVGEVKQLAPGPWRLQWLGPLRALLKVPKLGLLYLWSFVFAMLWSGNVPIMSLYTLDLVAAQPGSAGTEAYWVGAVAFALGVSGLIAMPLWGRALDRYDPARVLALAAGAAALSHVPLLFIETPLQLALARAAFGLSAGAMQPAIIRLLKKHAPPGMDARAISYAASFQFMAMGVAPFVAGLVGPVLGLRAYFALTIALTVASLWLWLRNNRTP